MLHLTDKREEKRLPRFKAVLTFTTSKGSYKMTVKATYFDLCIMNLTQVWISTWFNQKGTKAQLSKFAKINEEGIKSTEMVVEDSVSKDVEFGLEAVGARVIWTCDDPLVCGEVTVYNVKRFLMASIYYMSSFSSPDIRCLVRGKIVRSIVDAYKLDSEGAMTWAFGSGAVRDSCTRLRKYFRPIK